MKTMATVLLALVIVIPVVLGIWWLMWQLWQWVIPQVWAAAPHGFTHPSYWLFVGCLLLVSCIGRVIFGGK
jgi:hypothetical protein